MSLVQLVCEGESIKLILGAMRRFQANAKIIGLGCLALVNLAYKNDSFFKPVIEGGAFEAIVNGMRSNSEDVIP
jgi:hypothetical protein